MTLPPIPDTEALCMVLDTHPLSSLTQREAAALVHRARTLNHFDLIPRTVRSQLASSPAPAPAAPPTTPARRKTR